MRETLEVRETQVVISTFTRMVCHGGDIHQAISKIFSRKSSGKLTLNVSQGGIQSLEWVEKTNGQK